MSHKKHNPNDITTIRVRWSTKEELDKLGRKGESYEDIILWLIKIAKELTK